MPVKQLSCVSPALSEGSFPRAAGDRAVESATRRSAASVSVCLLTGGDDRPYALGMASALAGQGISVDFIGSDKLDAPELHNSPQINFLNLRGDQSEDAPLRRKIVRILAYYVRLAKYAARSEARIFHILWNNKFEHFDRTLLMLYYRLLRKRILLTAHNVNMRKRDGCDSWWNRLSLRVQYRLAHHIFVHTQRMRSELLTDFGVSERKVSVIPFGINNTVPTSTMTAVEAKRMFGIHSSDKTMLCFGQIAPYKGLEYLIDAFSEVAKGNGSYRLIIAGKVKKGREEYWNEIQRKIASSEIKDQIIKRIEHIPDEEVELYFKAADVLIVPYVHIFQSGVPFLAYSFGLPVIATDVGSLRQDIVEGRTGFICRAKDSSDLANMIYQYFDSELFRDLEIRREEIKRYANERYAWENVAEITKKVYEKLSGEGLAGKSTGPSI
jgi:D-inositol-3-phosphate glycosyltransferase